jgi:pimeloyl-ACP methyl ester carboxylesterase
VVGLAAIADVEHYHGLGIGWDDGCGDAPVRLLGGHAPLDAPERLSQASPAALGPTGVPRLLLTGADDRAVPPEHGEAYVAGAVAGGEEAEHHVLARSAHFEIVAPWTPAWQEAWALVGPFLDRIQRSG